MSNVKPPNLDSCLDEAALRQLLSGDLDSPDAVEAVCHIDECQRCQAKIDQLATGQLNLDSKGTLEGIASATDHRCDEVVARLIRVIRGETLGSASSETTEQVPVPDTLEHFEVKGLLGQGGMGAVLKAWDTKLNRFVAIKQLRPMLMGDEDLRKRILAEARAAAAINHPGVVPVYSIHDDSDPAFFVMEWVDGKSLQQLLKEGQTFSVAQIVAMTEQLVEAIHAAHQCKVVHCDIKPANVLVDEVTGRPRLTDFGISYAASVGDSERTGKYIGTPHFMSPEQCREGNVDARTDLFSLGVLIYRMLSSRFPFEGQTVDQLKNAICNEPPARLSEICPDVPPWFDKLVHQLLEKDRAQRPQSASDVLEVIRHHRVSHHQTRPSIRSRGVVGLIFVLLGAMAVLLIWNRANFSGAASGNERLINTRQIFADSGQRLGHSPASGVAIADMDGDGDLDAVVCYGKFNNPQPNRIWFNDGHGVFHESEQSIGERISSGAAVGDVDGDGDLDVFFANWSDRKEAWGENRLWLNDGFGNLEESAQSLGSQSARNVKLADLDQDGDLDAWVANYKESDRIWLNDGQGNFEMTDQRINQMGSSCVDLADIDRDGDLDAVVVGQNSRPCSVWLNRGDATFEPGNSFGEENMWWIVLKDVNHDQMVDAIVREKSGLRVYQNDGNGEFQKTETFWPCSGPCRLAVADINDDGHADIMVGNELGSPSFYLLNDGNGKFPEKSDEIHVGSVSGIGFGDFDQDGDVDVFFSNGHDRTPHQPDQIWLNQIFEPAED